MQQPYWPTTVMNGYALNYHTAINNAISFGTSQGNGPEAPSVSVIPQGTVFNGTFPPLVSMHTRPNPFSPLHTGAHPSWGQSTSYSPTPYLTQAYVA